MKEAFQLFRANVSQLFPHRRLKNIGKGKSSYEVSVKESLTWEH